jgi:hypothetical protein
LYASRQDAFGSGSVIVAEDTSSRLLYLLFSAERLPLTHALISRHTQLKVHPDLCTSDVAPQ